MLIVQNVFGYTLAEGIGGTSVVMSAVGGNELFIDPMKVPRYTQSIAEAWKVVEAMRTNGWHFTLKVHPLPALCETQAAFSREEKNAVARYDGVASVDAAAVRIAALAALGVAVEVVE